MLPVDVRRPARASPGFGRGVLSLLAAAVATSTLSCRPLDECRLNSDCPIGASCVNARCVTECREDRDCVAPQICSVGACVEPGPPERLCAGTRDCQDGEVCAGGVCTMERTMVDAGPPPTPGDGGLPAARDAGPADGGFVGDGGVSGQPYGAVCSAGSQCVSGLCLGVQGAPTGRCTAMCADDAECFYPDRCLEVAGAGGLCGSAQSGGPVGAPCPNGPADCASGLCLALPGRPPVCTQNCAPLPTCPSGMTCVPLPDGSGGSTPVCAPGNGLGFGAQCNAASQCFSMLCLGVGGASSGVCTIGCEQIPCPAGYACAEVDDGSGGALPICAPSGGVGGQLGDQCAGASACASGLCLFDARLQDAYCTQSCRSGADCAALPGLACVTLTDGSRVCAPP
jgi:hypothetical protein